jgi:hypothetical protein
MATVTSLPFCKHTGGGGATPTFSDWLVYLQITWEVPLPSSPVEPSSWHCYNLSRSKVSGRSCHSCLLRPACLFIVLWGIASPPLFRALGTPSLFGTCLVVVVVVYSVFFSVFSLGGGQSVQGATLTWPRVVCGSTPCRLAHLVVYLFWAGRSWHLAVREPSWFPSLPWSRDAMHGLGVWQCQTLTSSWWFFLQCVSPASLQDFTLGSTLSASCL